VAVAAARRELDSSEARVVDCLLGLERDASHPYVARTPGVCGGEPVVAGTAVAVEAIAEYFFAGKEIWEVQRDYPHLTQDEILDALHFVLDRRNGEDSSLTAGEVCSGSATARDQAWAKPPASSSVG